MKASLSVLATIFFPVLCSALLATSKPMDQTRRNTTCRAAVLPQQSKLPHLCSVWREWDGVCRSE
ncbi:hypothetical protein EJ02DRAFT_455597 [Clathrospora elynae]|uniref:Uncharacterized protein n=1 Tax=Clathrospora elynae TaxID=706981 RepID=A0A6A5SJX6_9PLEO|nr:hypothetical protein EJ02DRAFT_455597 [Clathrospora elynae]